MSKLKIEQNINAFKEFIVDEYNQLFDNYQKMEQAKLITQKELDDLKAKYDKLTTLSLQLTGEVESLSNLSKDNYKARYDQLVRLYNKLQETKNFLTEKSLSMQELYQSEAKKVGILTEENKKLIENYNVLNSKSDHTYVIKVEKLLHHLRVDYTKLNECKESLVQENNGLRKCKQILLNENTDLRKQLNQLVATKNASIHTDEVNSKLFARNNELNELNNDLIKVINELGYKVIVKPKSTEVNSKTGEAFDIDRLKSFLNKKYHVEEVKPDVKAEEIKDPKSEIFNIDTLKDLLIKRLGKDYTVTEVPLSNLFGKPTPTVEPKEKYKNRDAKGRFIKK